MDQTSKKETNGPPKDNRPAPPWVCANCATLSSKPIKRLPQGWKRRDDNKLFCGTCWSKQYLLRAVVLPIVSPLNCTWDEMRASIKANVGRNLQGSQLDDDRVFVIDVRRNGEEKMPPMPSVYLYPTAREKFPTLPAASIATLEQAVLRKYKARRYEVVWTNSASLPTFRYPTPFAAPNQAWSVSITEECPIVTVRIGDKRISARLKGGPRFRRQLASVKLIESGAAVKGQLEIYQQGTDIMCKLVAWLPREERTRPEKTRTLVVKTGTDSLLLAFDEKYQHIWTYNGDHLKRWTMEHSTQLQRWSQDQKPEERPVPSFAARRTIASDRYHRRMSTACQEISSMLVNYARRRRFSGIRYDDTEKGFLIQFPWFRFAESIELKCDANGIAFEKLGAEIIPEPPVSAL